MRLIGVIPPEPTALLAPLLDQGAGATPPPAPTVLGVLAIAPADTGDPQQAGVPEAGGEGLIDWTGEGAVTGDSAAGTGGSPDWLRRFLLDLAVAGEDPTPSAASQLEPPILVTV